MSTNSKRPEVTESFYARAYDAIPACSAPLGLVALPEEERMYRMLTEHLMAAMRRACLTTWQMELCMDAFLLTSQVLAADARLAAMAREPEPAWRREYLPEQEKEPEPVPVSMRVVCTACQRDFGERVARTAELAAMLWDNYKCRGCLREGR